MGTLGFALFVVLAVRMALVIVVALFPAFAMVLTIAVLLGLGVAAVTVAITLGGRCFGFTATLKDENSRSAPSARTTAMAIKCFLLMMDLLVFMVIFSSALRSGVDR